MGGGQETESENTATKLKLALPLPPSGSLPRNVAAASRS